MRPTVRRSIASLLSLLVLVAFAAQAEDSVPTAPTNPRVRFDTSAGSFVVQLNPERAPLTVAEFLSYVREGHYNGTIFHRVVENFIAQGGGYTPDFKEKSTHKTIANESGNGLSNTRGTIAMARTSNPHSATCQFFINLADNNDLNPLPTRWGYAVFGEVVEGMDLIDRIGHAPTGKLESLGTGVPLKPVVIEKAQVLQ